LIEKCSNFKQVELSPELEGNGRSKDQGHVEEKSLIKQILPKVGTITGKRGPSLEKYIIDV